MWSRRPGLYMDCSADQKKTFDASGSTRTYVPNLASTLQLGEEGGSTYVTQFVT